jgi:phage shock protein A
MSIFTRIGAIFGSRANQIAEAFEDPKASLDYSLVRLEQNRALLAQGLIEVAAARNRLAAQRDLLSSAVEKTQSQAELAVRSGRDDLARIALERKQEAASRQYAVETNLASLDRQAEALKQAQADLDHKIATFRSKKEELKAVYDSARAQLIMREAVSGISGDLADVGSTIRRAEERIREMQSRADAIEGLVAEGVLVDAFEPHADDLDHQLLLVDHQNNIETELARLKSGLEE